MRPILERAEQVLEQARALAGRVESWPDYCQALFHPDGGIVPDVFPTVRERREFTMTPQYAAVYDLLRDLMAKSSAVDGHRPGCPVPSPADDRSPPPGRDTARTSVEDRPPWVVPFPNPEDRSRSPADSQARPGPCGPLSQSRLAEILTSFRRRGYSQEADELRRHITWLEGERDTIGQYYEEYLIPLLEGRPIGRPGRTWAERMQDEAGRERMP